MESNNNRNDFETFIEIESWVVQDAAGVYTGLGQLNDSLKHATLFLFCPFFVFIDMALWVIEKHREKTMSTEYIQYYYAIGTGHTGYWYLAARRTTKLESSLLVSMFT